MFKTIKKIWRKIEFLGIFRFLGRLYYILFFVGLALYGLYFLTDGSAFFYEGSRVTVKRGIDMALKDHWKNKSGEEPYLNASFPVSEIPVLFTKKHVAEEVNRKLKPYNYKVNARKSNRANGFSVKEDYRYDYVVRAYYTDDVKVNGKTTTRLWLISENYLKKHNLEEVMKKYEI